MNVTIAGLLGEHVPEAELARSAADIQSDARQREVGGDTAWRGHVGTHLGPGHVPTQRETRQLPRSDRQQSASATEQLRVPVVRHRRVPVITGYTCGTSSSTYLLLLPLTNIDEINVTQK